MRDWNALVREHLKLADLSPGQQDETIAELASHLGDLCEEYRAQGLNESEAVRRALEEVTDWRHLAGTIQRAKRKEGSMTDRTMNDRTKHLWLPGLVSFSAAMILLAILIQISLQPRYLGRSPLYMVFLPWLALLPPLWRRGSLPLSPRRWIPRGAPGLRLVSDYCVAHSRHDLDGYPPGCIHPAPLVVRFSRHRIWGRSP